LAEQFITAIDLRNVRQLARTLKNVIIGSDIITAMINNGMATTRNGAIQIGKRLMKDIQLFSLVNNRNVFKEERSISCCFLCESIASNRRTLGA
jgi:hypothetical protein